MGDSHLGDRGLTEATPLWSHKALDDSTRFEGVQPVHAAFSLGIVVLQDPVEASESQLVRLTLSVAITHGAATIRDWLGPRFSKNL